MFQQLQAAPPDAILGLAEDFKKDSNPDKINLTVGLYKDAHGDTPILECVKTAEARLLQSEQTKAYLGIEGSPEFGNRVRELLFGAVHEIETSARSATLHAPGGTGALRVAADFVKKLFPSARVWCSDPTWPNHPQIFEAAGLQVTAYRYFDRDRNGLDLNLLIDALRQIPAGDVVCLHACCHNPTGSDPTQAEWRRIADVVYERGLLPLLDFAYQGFGDGLPVDAAGLAEFCRPGCELFVASSFSKNFGLYRERVGALTAVASDANSARVVLSQLKSCARANYSNPPAHGAAVVASILGDNELRRQWETELANMRDRIQGMRSLFAECMALATGSRQFDFIMAQKGMFSFSGLTAAQVEELRAKHAIYIVRNGRINVAGMTADNMDRLCGAIASVL